MPLLNILLAQGEYHLVATGTIRPMVYRQEVSPLDVLHDYGILVSTAATWNCISGTAVVAIVCS